MGIIIAISVAVVSVVALLLYNSQNVSDFDRRIYILPKVNAFINGSVFLLLLGGFAAIRAGRVKVHRALMLSAFVLSSLFLVSYIIYHANAPETHYSGEGAMRKVYFSLLLSHILLATIIVPLALITLFRIFKMQVNLHRRIARITLPIWLYVSLTGVIIYLMISPDYPL